MALNDQKVNGLSMDVVREHFDYDELTGNLYWLKHKKIRNIGKDACSKQRSYGTGQKYKNVFFMGRNYAVHRLIWIYHHGDIGSNKVDHKDGDTFNNRIENLRMCTSVENNRNAALRSDNKSGYSGVSFNEKRSEWYAIIHHGGKVIPLGSFESKRDALIARQAAERVLGYSSRHGKVSITKKYTEAA